MIRHIIIVNVLFFINGGLLSQNKTKDSIIKTVQLEEVCIFDEHDDNNQSFNFYRNNKLASTEDILSRMQGVNLIKRGAYGLEPTLRNYGTGQTNLTIDGMRMYGACTDKMDPVSIYIEPTNLQTIQVSQGAAGALDGSTIGGQINLRMKEPAFNCHSKISGQVSQAFLTVNEGYNSSLTFQQSLKKLAYRVSGTFRHANDYKAGSDSLIQHSGYQKANVSATVIYKLTNSQLLKADYLGDLGKNIGYPALPMDVGKAKAQILSLTHRYELGRTFFKKNELKVYYNQVEHQMDDTHRPDAPMHMDMPGWSQTTGFYNELTGMKNFRVRLDFHHATTRADMTMYPVGEPNMYVQTLPENNLNDLGFAAGRSFYLKGEHEVSVNARVDLFSQAAVAGPGSAQWKVFNTDITQSQINFLKNLNVAYIKRVKRTYGQFSLGYGERIPTSNERYGYYLFNRQDQYDYIGNLQLKPEQSYQMEFLFKQVFKKVEYSVNLFYHHTQNYIYAYQLPGYSQMTIGAYGLKTYKNIEYAVNQGFETSLKIQISSRLSYLGTAKYVFAQTFEAKPLPLVPPLKLQHVLRYNWELYQFQLEHDFATAQNRINSDYGDKATPSFNLFNIRASRSFRIKETVLQVAIACENILDTLYREHLDIGSVPRFGRNFLFNLNFIF